MTTYVYETITSDESEEPQFFEIQQSMKDAPLTHHPESGIPIRRVILGGYGTLTKTAAPPRGECGPSCACH